MDNSTYRILVVEDEPMVRELTILALEKDGFVADPAIDGKQAKEMLQFSSYDAVVTDLRMPRMNGHALAVSLLSQEDRPLIIVVTGIIEPRLAHDLFSRGVDDVFFKPVSHERLSTRLAELLENRRAATEKPAEGPQVKNVEMAC
jgi:DNA-binding response OmpR family regulator